MKIAPEIKLQKIGFSSLVSYIESLDTTISFHGPFTFTLSIKVQIATFCFDKVGLNVVYFQRKWIRQG